MIKLPILLILIFFGQSVLSQVDEDLKGELDSIFQLDQKYRNLLTYIYKDSISKDSVARVYHKQFNEIQEFVWKEQHKIDSSNLVFIENLLSDRGYPGEKLVGDQSNEVAWYVIQHSDKIEKYFKLIKRAGKNKELPYHLVAMMQDRLLMSKKKRQVYGTQGMCKNIKEGSERFCFIWPVRNPKKVNKRREKVGLTNTVEENAKRLNIEYSVVKLKNVK